MKLDSLRITVAIIVMHFVHTIDDAIKAFWVERAHTTRVSQGHDADHLRSR